MLDDAVASRIPIILAALARELGLPVGQRAAFEHPAHGEDARGSLRNRRERSPRLFSSADPCCLPAPNQLLATLVTLKLTLKFQVHLGRVG